MSVIPQMAEYTLKGSLLWWQLGIEHNFSGCYMLTQVLNHCAITTLLSSHMPQMEKYLTQSQDTLVTVTSLSLLLFSLSETHAHTENVT